MAKARSKTTSKKPPAQPPTPAPTLQTRPVHFTTGTPLDYVPIDATPIATSRSTYSPPSLRRALVAGLWTLAAGFILWTAWSAL